MSKISLKNYFQLRKDGVYSTFDFGRETRQIFMNQDKPKFIYLSLNAPHDPVSAPQVIDMIFLEFRIYFFLITCFNICISGTHR